MYAFHSTFIPLNATATGVQSSGGTPSMRSGELLKRRAAGCPRQLAAQGRRHSLMPPSTMRATEHQPARPAAPAGVGSRWKGSAAHRSGCAARAGTAPASRQRPSSLVLGPLAEAVGDKGGLSPALATAKQPAAMRQPWPRPRPRQPPSPRRACTARCCSWGCTHTQCQSHEGGVRCWWVSRCTTPCGLCAPDEHLPQVARELAVHKLLRVGQLRHKSVSIPPQREG